MISEPVASRRLAASTSAAAVAHRPVPLQLTRATGATRTAATRRSSRRNSSGSAVADTTHHPLDGAGTATSAIPSTVASSWCAGRSPSCTVTGADPCAESPTSDTETRPPSSGQGCGPTPSVATPRFDIPVGPYDRAALLVSADTAPFSALFDDLVVHAGEVYAPRGVDRDPDKPST